jgi:hypothetical protein
VDIIHSKKAKPSVHTGLTAKQFVEKLKTFQSAEELKKIQGYFKSGKGEDNEGDKFIGVKMGQVFALAKEFSEMLPVEIEKLLQNPIHEMRVGGVSIMDFQARSKKTQNCYCKYLLFYQAG